MEEKNIYPKSHFRMCITKLKRTEEDNKQPYKIVSSDWVSGNGKRFRESVFRDREKGIDRTIEIVNQKPKKFILNQIYMLRTRDVVWVWTED